MTLRDWLEPVLATVVLGTFSLFVFRLATRPGKYVPELDAVVLTFNWLIKGTGIFFVLAGIVFWGGITLIEWWQRPQNLKTGELLLVALFMVCTSGFGEYMLLDAMRTQIALTDAGIVRDTPWSGMKSLRWDQVERVTFSHMSGWFVLRAANHPSIRVSFAITGIGDFEAMLRRKLTPQQLKAAEAGFRRIAARL